MSVASWGITVFTVVLIGAFVLAVISLRELPLAERPKTRIYDRLGRPIGRTENPDYHMNPGEASKEGPDRVPVVRDREAP